MFHSPIFCDLFHVIVKLKLIQQCVTAERRELVKKITFVLEESYKCNGDLFGLGFVLLHSFSTIANFSFVLTRNDCSNLLGNS